MQKFLLLSLLLILCISGCAPQIDTAPPSIPEATERIEEPVDSIDRISVSEEMRFAIHEARSKLPEFWEAWEKNGFGEGDYIINVHFLKRDQSEGEFLWMSVEARGEGEVTGLLEGEPTIELDIKHGDRLTVKESEIVDWMFVPKDGDHKGGYTLKALGTSAE